MTPYTTVGSNVLYKGDSLDVLRHLPDDSVDSIVTDPPAGINFMGRGWDGDKGGRTAWVGYMEERFREALRVAKPGAHALVWALPRTSHWTAWALESAGWEVRDVIVHLFGTGFPKSMDVSKAIDKLSPRAGMFESFAVHFQERLTASGLTNKAVAEHFPSRSGGITGCVTNWARGYGVPTAEQWDILRPMLGLSETFGPLIARVEAERHDRRVSGYGSNNVLSPTRVVENAGTPVTDAAREWDGWGTALKPSSEHWVLARKPMRGTVADNVLEHGTGALNINGCRIPTDDVTRRTGRAEMGCGGGNLAAEYQTGSDAGRWPANTVLSCWCEGDAHGEDCAVRMLDEQSGTLVSNGGKGAGRVRANQSIGYGGSAVSFETSIYGDSGGASRFFYVAKPSKAEKHARGSVVNGHPTVKPVALMAYLIRLITPKGGIVLDMFAGSGTTGVACIRGGWRHIAIDDGSEESSLDTAAGRWSEEAGPLFA